VVSKVTVLGVLVALGASCSGGNSAWEWSAADELPPPEDAQFYFEYPEASDFALGAETAVVAVVDLKRNVLVPESPGAEPWVYTPMVVEIVESGDSGLDVGETLTIAVPGGTVGEFSSPSIWVFDKAALDPDSLYVVSWAPYDYPGFELDLVLQYVYEMSEDGAGLERLQEPAGPGPAQTERQTIPIGEAISAVRQGETGNPEVADALERASER